MSLQTFKVHLILKTDKVNKKGLAPIFARVRFNGIKIEISTNRNASIESWSAEKEAAFPASKINKELNQFLEEFRGKIYSAYSSILSTGKAISGDLLRQALFGKQVERKYYLIEVATDHNLNFEKNVGKKYSYGSYKNYKTTLKYLIEFAPFEYKQKDILLNEVDYSFCDRYFAFLTTQKRCNINGANKQIQRVKKIVNYAIKLGYLTSNLTNSYSLQFKPTKRLALSMDEINKLANLDLQRQTLSIVRDVFIFQCYTGLAYSDVKGLKPINIIKDESGEVWIKMERQKTDISFSVPLLKPALDLLQKYRIEGNQKGVIFPVLSNQKMNDNLKIIQELAGLSKSLTTHLARHSFATSLTLNNGVPIETVSKMLGHSNIRTTQIYAKVLETKIKSDMDKLKDKL